MPNHVFGSADRTSKCDDSCVTEDSEIVAVIGAHVKLHPVGRYWYGRCPYYGGSDHVFMVNGRSGRYICWSCGAKGDLNTFLGDFGHA